MPLLWPRSSRINQSLLVALLIISIFFYFTQNHAPLTPWSSTSVSSSSSGQGSGSGEAAGGKEPLQVNCTSLAGADDVFVVMKTGAGEARQKIPVHFNTTFRCIPYYAVCSDVEQEIEGHSIHDALADIDFDVQAANPEFATYRQMNVYAKEGREDFGNLLASPTGVKEDAPGWMLDKWKFLPLLEKAIKERPEAKWYFFMEADTFVVWSNLLRWLAMFDHHKSYYLGGQAFLGNQEFAHGGAGYVLSQKAVKDARDAVRKNPARYDRKVAEECCGDVILGMVMSDIGVEITRSWPIVQGETPSTLDYSAHHWCHPVVSQHHMSAEETTEMWEFEQQWIYYNVSEGSRGLTGMLCRLAHSRADGRLHRHVGKRSCTATSSSTSSSPRSKKSARTGTICPRT